MKSTEGAGGIMAALGADPTVVSDETRAAIEQNAGVRLHEVDPEVLSFVVEASRKCGNDHFKRGEYQKAAESYSQAIAGRPDDFTLFGNRSAAYLALGRASDALLDASKAVLVSKSCGTPWAKGYYRLGCALERLERYDQATEAFSEGLALEPQNARLADKRDKCAGLAEDAKNARVREEGTARRDLVLKLREARRAEVQLQMQNQYKQAMQSPNFEMEDFDWRPTFFPSSRLRRRGERSSTDSSYVAAVAGYCRRLFDLESPRRDLGLLSQGGLLGAYEAALAAALKEQPGAHVLVLGSGSCVLGLMALRCGARRVTCAFRTPSLRRMASVAARENLEDPSRITLLESPVEECVVEDRADVVVTDWFDHTVLGLGVIPSLETAASRLARPGAKVVPQRVAVRAAIAELRIAKVSGFDLSYLNAYRWHPGHDRCDLSRELAQGSETYRLASDSFVACEVDLQQRLDAFAGGSGAGVEEAGENGERPEWEAEERVEAVASEDCVANAVAFWMEIHFGGGGAPVTTWPGHPAASSQGWPSAGHLGQAVSYFDEVPLSAGDALEVSVFVGRDRLLFHLPGRASRPRHACVPAWHYDMLLDSSRNDAYEGAIRRCVESRRAFASSAKITALDVGAGSGLLSMLAARAGADAVVAVEVSQHMCDVGEECVVMNGFAHKVLFLNRDARRMDVSRKPDGTPPDMEDKADIMVYEVFDSGLIGEGALHLVAAARARLLKPNASIIPCAARVYCAPISIRVASAAGFDFGQLNRYSWRPDYVGVELESIPGDWEALADPVEVFSFDFYEHEANMAPAEKRIEFAIKKDGVVSAFAFWFDLQLDEEEWLSTSPYGQKGRTWQQAVQVSPRPVNTSGSIGFAAAAPQCPHSPFFRRLTACPSHILCYSHAARRGDLRPGGVGPPRGRQARHLRDLLRSGRLHGGPGGSVIWSSAVGPGVEGVVRQGNGGERRDRPLLRAGPLGVPQDRLRRREDRNQAWGLRGAR